jgi:DHA1 family bicyclomycin/chloramphenicol resistance-like MFS transporter
MYNDWNMEQISRTRLIFILGLLSAIGPFSIDMYLPGFPVIAADLKTTPEMVSYSLSSYFIGICAGQMLIGPLLDRFGRKPPLLGGLLLYIISALGCAWAPTIEALIVFRFFQAAGGCAGMVAPRAIIRDVFPVHENARIFSLLILIIGVSPIIAPTAGGFITSHYGWHSIFLLLAAITFLISMAVIFLLPESRKADPTFSLKPKPIIASFSKVITTPQFSTYAFTGSLASAGLYAYLAGSPFVFMDLYHVSGQHYGWIFAIVAGGLIASSQVNNILLRKYRSEQIVPVVLAVQCLIATCLVGGTMAGVLNLYGTIACIFFYLCCQGFSFPNSSALSMAPFTKEAGSASALLGAIQMALGAFASALVGIFSDGTALPMVGVMAACSFSAVTVLAIGRRVIGNKIREEDLQEETLDMIEKT